MDFTFVNERFESIWNDRYRKNKETIDGNFRRVAKFCSKNESEYREFYKVISEVLFLPAGRTMSNSAIGKDLTLNNCFIAPQIGDSLSDIFSKVALGAKTHQKGGGIGYDFSNIRPSGTPTSNDAIASGPVSFIDVFNAQTATILQGNRRGANMGVLNVYHPDIFLFLEAKAHDEHKLNHFNISVMVDDDFVTAVKNDKDIYLHYPVYDDNGNIVKDPDKWLYKSKVSAKDIWDMIIKQAYTHGEPGVFFYENLNNDNNLWYIEKIVASNPCAEYLGGTVYGINPLNGEPLNPDEFGGACNLGSLFLHNFVVNPFKSNASIDLNKMEKAIFTGVKMLDNIIDINKFPDPIYENYQKNFRTIGFGITGLADMLVMLNLDYRSREARIYVDHIMNFIAKSVYRASIELAKERGSFPFLVKDKYVQSNYLKKHADYDSDWTKILDDIKTYGIRNAKLLSIAPVGTLSLTYGNNCSSGLEPIFSLEYDRKVKMGGQSDDDIKIITIRDYAYGKWLEVKDDEDIIVDKSCFTTALNMSVDEHVNMLSAIAWHIDMSCSKTINVPTDYSFENVKDIYMKCHDVGIKGCTIFRPNEIRQGIMLTNSEQKSSVSKNIVTSMDDLPRGMIVKVDNNCIGLKRTLHTGCGTLHCEAFFDPDTGHLLETYFSKGSQGGCNNFMIGLSRMVSLAARGGVDIYSIADQLQSSGACPSYTSRTATKHDTSKGSSCPVAISYALIDMHKQFLNMFDIEDDNVESEPKKIASLTKEAKTAFNTPICPECGGLLVFEGGCNTCKDCGWSKCS